MIFVPEENVDAVADALASEGAGVIGEYTRCTFRTPGTGTFLGGEATDPYLGEKGQLEKVEEIRLETVVPPTPPAAPQPRRSRPTPTKKPPWTCTPSKATRRAAVTAGPAGCRSRCRPRS